jgi:hypothetical protein
MVVRTRWPVVDGALAWMLPVAVLPSAAVAAPAASPVSVFPIPETK